MSRRAASSATRTRVAQKDVPAVVVEPPPEDEYTANLTTLRRNWKWAAFSQFFYTFAPLFAMPDVALTDIEDDLARGTALYLPRVVHRLLYVLTQDRKLSLDNWQTVLRRQYLRRDPELNPLGPDPADLSYKASRATTETREINDEEGDQADAEMKVEATIAPQNGEPVAEKTEEQKEPATTPAKEEAIETEEQKPETAVEEEASKNWLDLTMLEKLDSLHLLTEWQFHNTHRLRTTMRSDGDYAEWRIEPIGYDAKTNAYWLIGPDRLWIQRVPPKPASSKRKRKANPPKANGKASTSKAAPAKDSESEAEASPAKRARSSKTRSTRTRNEMPAQSSTGRGTRAAKVQAKEKLDAQKRAMEEFQRQGIAETKSTTRTLRDRSRTQPTPSRKVVGTRASARLRGADRDEDEWQEIPDEWLSEAQESDVKPRTRTRSNARVVRLSRKGKARAEPESSSEDESSEEQPDVARTGLESSDDVSDLTELSDDQEDAKPPAQQPKEEDDVQPALSDKGVEPLVTEQAQDKAKGPPHEEPAPQLPAGFIEWEAICITLPEWEEIGERFAKATHYLEKALHKMLQQIVPEVVEELREAEHKRVLEEAIVHRKRSSRIAIKESEKEEQRLAAQKKAEEDAQLARTRRMEARAKKEESEREKRERAREQRRIDREERERRAEGRKTSAAPTISASAHSVRSSMQPSRNNTPNGARTPDWTLDCELCGACGVNMDEGAPMVACGICSRWQHIKCHDNADARAGRAPRNWDTQPFYCKRCKPVAEQRGARQSGGSERRNHRAPSQKAGAPLTPYYPYPQTSDPRYSQPTHQGSSSPYALPHSPVHHNGMAPASPAYARTQRNPEAIAFSHYQPDQHGFSRSTWSNGYSNGMHPQSQPAQYTQHQPYMANGGYGSNHAYQVPLQQSYARTIDIPHHNPMPEGPSPISSGWPSMNHGHYPSSAARSSSGSMSHQYQAPNSYGYTHPSTNGQQSWSTGGPYQHAPSSSLSPTHPPSIPPHPHQHQQPLGNGTYQYPTS